MRPLRLWLLVLLVAVVFLAWPGAGSAAPFHAGVSPTPTIPPLPVVKKGAVASVRYILRGLGVKPPHKKQVKGKLRMQLYNAYDLQTGARQKASINFADGTLLHLNQRTDAVLRSATVTSVKSGEIDQVVIPGTHHQVQTAAGVASAIGTEYDVRFKKKVMTVIVIEGAVLLTNKKGSVVVKSGQESTVKRGKAPTPPRIVDAGAAVVWVKPIPPPPLATPMNVALDANGGQIVDVSSQAPAPPPLRQDAVTAHSAKNRDATSASPWDVHGINDGHLDIGWSSAAGQNKAQWVKLAFASLGTYPISEVLIDPAATGGHPAANDLNDFTIRVSTTTSDESQFQTVFRGSTAQQDSMQVFTLPPNTVARYVELRAIDNYGGNEIDVAEFEVVASGPALAAPTATPTSTSTSTPTPTATSLAAPTATPTPTVTATPAPTPTGTQISYTVSLATDSASLPAGAPANLSGSVTPAPTDSSTTLVLQEVRTAASFRDEQTTGLPCPPGPTCNLTVTKGNDAPGTYTYTLALQRSDGTVLARSPSVSVTWTAFVVTAFAASATNVSLGTRVRFTAVLNQPIGKSTYMPFVAEVRTNSQLATTCTDTTCIADAQATVPGSYIFVFVLVDTSGKVVLQVGQVVVYWQWTVTLSADHSTVPAGSPINLTATANADVGGSTYSIVIAASSGNNATCTTGSACTWQVTSNAPGSFNFEAYIVDSSGNQVANSGQPLTLTWQQSWSISLSANPTNPAFQATSTLTAMANADVSSAGYHIRIEDAHNGYVYNQCSSGASCSVNVPYNDVSGGTGCSSQGTGSCDYIGIIWDGSNTIAQSPVVTVTWQAGLAADARVRRAAPTVLSSHHRGRAALPRSRHRKLRPGPVARIVPVPFASLVPPWAQEATG